MALQINSDIEENIELQLGDIIQITSASNELNNKIFLIDYIDTSQILLINDVDLSKIILTLDENGAINNYDIGAIVILDRPDISGYAFQHDLLVNSFIEIVFLNNIKIVGTIVDLNIDDDLIAIETNLPNKNIIYLNFNFKGIPQNLGIETIKKIVNIDDHSKEIAPIISPIVDPFVVPFVEPIFAEELEMPEPEMPEEPQFEETEIIYNIYK